MWISTEVFYHFLQGGLPNTEFLGDSFLHLILIVNKQHFSSSALLKPSSITIARFAEAHVWPVSPEKIAQWPPPQPRYDLVLTGIRQVETWALTHFTGSYLEVQPREIFMSNY